MTDNTNMLEEAYDALVHAREAINAVSYQLLGVRAMEFSQEISLTLGDADSSLDAAKLSITEAINMVDEKIEAEAGEDGDDVCGRFDVENN
jgi:hypothetical protein